MNETSSQELWKKLKKTCVCVSHASVVFKERDVLAAHGGIYFNTYDRSTTFLLIVEVKVDELDKNLLPLTLLPPFMILLGSSSIVLHIFPNNQCLTFFAFLPIFYPISKISDNLAVDITDWNLCLVRQVHKN